MNKDTLSMNDNELLDTLRHRAVESKREAKVLALMKAKDLMYRGSLTESTKDACNQNSCHCPLCEVHATNSDGECVGCPLDTKDTVYMCCREYEDYKDDTLPFTVRQEAITAIYNKIEAWDVRSEQEKSDDIRKNYKDVLTVRSTEEQGTVDAMHALINPANKQHTIQETKDDT